MAYLVAYNWGWLAAAWVLGFIIGWVSPISRVHMLSRAGSRWAVALLIALLLVSLTHLAPGRIGYWLDLGLVMIVSYLAGCAVGAWLRYLLLLRPARP